MSKSLRVVAALVLLCALSALPAGARPLATSPDAVSLWEIVTAPLAALWNVLSAPVTSSKQDSDARGGIDPWGGTTNAQPQGDCRGGIDPWGGCYSGE
jgi:hypothetical protein